MEEKADLLSIVIPVALSETQHMELLQQLSVFIPHTEILMVSEDPIEDLPMGVQWVETTGETKAKAMNDGAAQATRPYVLFLHADTAISPIALSRLHAILSKEIQHNASARNIYYFSPLRFLDDGPWACAINGFIGNEMAQIFDLPSGHQGLCLPMHVFKDVGGFPKENKYSEDWVFVNRLKFRGARVRAVDSPIYTSKRRFEAYGWFYTTVINSARKLGILTKSLIFGPNS